MYCVHEAFWLLTVDNIRIVRYRRGRAPNNPNVVINQDNIEVGNESEAAEVPNKRQPRCKTCGHLQLGHPSKRHPITKKKKKYPCSFTPEELEDFDKIAATLDSE